MNRYEELGFFDFEDFVEELNEEELFCVNGGACGGGYCYTPSYSGGCSGGGTVTSSYPLTCGGGYSSYMPNYTKQNYWDNKYGPEFGKHACAATSILNEIGEQFRKEKGRSMTDYEKTQAMKSAIEGGKIDSSDAYVNDWAAAATLMAESLKMNGRYRETKNVQEADVVVFAYDYKTYHTDTNTYTQGPDGVADHFINDVGNGKVYDPYDGVIKNIDTSKLQKGRETRMLDYY